MFNILFEDILMQMGGQLIGYVNTRNIDIDI